ncbi:hypothetical protein EDM53_02385 [Rickettsiales endosymbiont of Peranema trichophorum]|uniref:IS110 family transposase n=1 Tax=Rickettsiales endosymbiont of Peranema trichophorum TaxID=2486577 RepID=UPI001023D3F9|nr:transposase [Rickettsiales endosymbiont of Peranema trichophorum]RZI47353.1 hypothetical protein EDM53_02385 [Rickettsiales endosymbiont of Peranema trichophorum]
MKYYIGLDVSLKETFINVINVNDKGKTVYECSVLSEAGVIGDCLSERGYKEDAVLGIESGQLSIHLCKALSKAGFEVKWVDARHMAAALSARINKNDKNDALGIAIMLRNECYKNVQIKSEESCELKVMIGSRRQQIIGTIRGLLKIYGIKLQSSKHGNFIEVVKRNIAGLSNPVIPNFRLNQANGFEDEAA